MAEADVTSVTVPAQQLQRVASAHLRRTNLSFLYETQERREKYLKLCVPLHNAARKGDWKAAKKILDKEPSLSRAALTKDWGTVLHVAAGANHVHFVEELVNVMDPEDLELQQVNGHTAFFSAAATGSTQIVEIILRRNRLLPKIRSSQGLTPLHVAALQGQSEMAWHLFPLTIDEVFLENSDWIILLFFCVNSGIYDLALELLEKKPGLAFERDSTNNETILHILARNPLSSICQSQPYRKRRLVMSSLRQTQQLELIKYLWGIFLKQVDSVIMDTIREGSHVIFNALEVGNFEFLAELLSTYPDLIWEVDERNRSIIHVAVLYPYADIFNLIYDIGPTKDFIASFEDEEVKDNLLHMAARLAPPDRLSLLEM